MEVPVESAKTAIDGDWTCGMVFYQAAPGNICRLYDRKPDSLSLHVCEKVNESGLGFDFFGKLTEINSA